MNKNNMCMRVQFYIKKRKRRRLAETEQIWLFCFTARVADDSGCKVFVRETAWRSKLSLAKSIL